MDVNPEMIQILESDKNFRPAIITKFREANTLEINVEIEALSRETETTKKRGNFRTEKYLKYKIHWVVSREIKEGRVRKLLQINRNYSI